MKVAGIKRFNNVKNWQEVSLGIYNANKTIFLYWMIGATQVVYLTFKFTHKEINSDLSPPQIILFLWTGGSEISSVSYYSGSSIRIKRRYKIGRECSLNAWCLVLVKLCYECLPYCQWMRCCLSLDGRTVDMFNSFSSAIYISRVQSKYCTGEKGDKKVHLMESKHRRRNWNLSGKSSTMTHSLEVYQPCFITMRHSFGACLVET